LFKTNRKKFGFRRVESEKIGSHPGGDLLQSVLLENDSGVEI